MKTLMYMSSNKISLGIIGKPNSGKSTLFNTLLGENLSPVGDEYGLTKTLYKQSFKHRNYEFTVVDTPGLRRRSKVTKKDEIARNTEVIRILNNVDVIILLIDALENITKQDFRLADLAIERNNILFFIFNKIDIIEDKKKYQLNLKRYLQSNYSKNKLINVDFISAKKNRRVNNVLDGVISKNELLKKRIHKLKLNNFINYLNKKSSYPKINRIEVKPKYIVQSDNKMLRFKVFLNVQKKAPQIFQKYFDNAFRTYFRLDGVPIIYDFRNSKNPYVN